jgi:hypothetical protein
MLPTSVACAAQDYSASMTTGKLVKDPRKMPTQARWRAHTDDIGSEECGHSRAAVRASLSFVRGDPPYFL